MIKEKSLCIREYKFKSLVRIYQEKNVNLLDSVVMDDYATKTKSAYLGNKIK